MIMVQSEVQVIRVSGDLRHRDVIHCLITGCHPYLRPQNLPTDTQHVVLCLKLIYDTNFLLVWKVFAKVYPSFN